MDIQQLRYFVAVAQYGKVKDAADAMFISRQAVSKALAQLENELGQPLFQRTHNGIMLNERGQRFVDRAEVLVREFDVLNADMRKDEQVCRVRICFPFTTYHYFWNVLEPFLVKNEDRLRVDVINCLDAQCHMMFENSLVDMAVSFLRFGPGTDDQLVATSPILFAVNEKNPLAGKVSLALGDLAHVPLIYYMNGYEDSFWLDKNCRKGDYEVNDILLAFDLVRQNKGIFAVPELAVLQSMQGIVFLPYHGPSDYDNFYCAVAKQAARDKRRRQACFNLREALLQAGREK
ncbi:MAG: LysR family transcriptional regulator [Desulfitobacterium hafniense]|uniref:Transcriptional regulator, LysR n=2 Tax=root TaxID=1 RepID=A0A098B1G2_DESHA|nr:LysR family transcriptional regulator [Desulfitobacterium hafniense]MEA5024632.1 LysR family transcriptional regulator [Desulfitobacterium hafniense]CDX02719.1 Transcriptional regulator, LysR [Desulfitobacterium hafniense]